MCTSYQEKDFNGTLHFIVIITVVVIVVIATIIISVLAPKRRDLVDEKVLNH